MEDSAYVLEGFSPTSVRLLKVFIAASIIDNGGTLDVSRKALSELSDMCGKHKGFQLLATPDDDHNMNLTLEWYD